MGRKEILSNVASLLKDAPIDGTKRSDIKPLLWKKLYRGKNQWVAGYSWSRPGSPYYGMVYDCVLGWGETPERALSDMRERVAAKAKAEG